MDEARQMAFAALGRVGEGIDQATVKVEARRAPELPERDRVETVVALFLDRHARPKLKQTTAADQESMFRRYVVPAWEGQAIQSIERRDVVALLDDLSDHGLTVRRKRVKAHPSEFFNFAVVRDVVGASPVAGIERPQAGNARERVLSDEELPALWRASGRAGCPFDAFTRLLLTGTRRTEAAGARWEEIDTDARTWTLPAARVKNERQHAIPLSDEAVAVLAGIPRIRGCPHVFSADGLSPVTGVSSA